MNNMKMQTSPSSMYQNISIILLFIKKTILYIIVEDLELKCELKVSSFAENIRLGLEIGPPL